MKKKVYTDFSLFAAYRKPLIVSMIISFIITSSVVKSQYPYVINMSQAMIGNATIVARQEINHLSGFEATPGLEYDAYIDPAFSGSGTPYDPPPEPGAITVTPSGKNYIISSSPQLEGFNPSPSITYTCAEVIINITYFDGFGREQQEIAVMGSADQKDVIKNYSYDPYNRKNKEYIPYEHINQQNGRYDTSYENNQKNFIQSIFGEQEREFGYAESAFEKSPLNRVVKQSAPGKDWAINEANPGLEHLTEFEYTSNQSISSWKCRNGAFVEVNYGAGQLFVTVTKNENKNLNRLVTYEYKDKEGKVILKESMVDGLTYQTFYIYDDYDLLRCVVPPKATSWENQELCYFYNYDARHRLCEKKLPGAGWQYLVYDIRNRMVMSQNAKMHQEDSTYWLMTSYDKLNRAVMTGIYKHTSFKNRKDMQELYDGLAQNINESRTGNANSFNHGYSRIVADQLGGSNAIYDILTVNYYDNYSFAPTGYGFDENNGLINTVQKLPEPRNRLSGSKIKIPGNPSSLRIWMLNATYYDHDYRIIQTVGDNPCYDGTDIITNKYSFSGLLLAQKTRHTAFGATHELTEQYTYDHAGRMIEHALEGLPNQPKIMMTALRYDQQGQLKYKAIHAEANSGTYMPFIQKTDYLYNIRGWMTSINNPENLVTDHDIFAMRLHYNDEMASISVQKQYNGNISAVDWATNLSSERSAYGFSYDPLSRITSAAFYGGSGNGWNHDFSFDETNLQYDKNGNIKTLDRYGASQLKIDELQYSYITDGNRLSYIEDAKGDKPGLDYPGNSSTIQSFFYDANGNMTTSNDKGLNVAYNYLDKPEVLDFGSGEKIQYFYDAFGNKVAKQLFEGNAISASSVIYSGNFVYNWNGVLQYILINEGRLVPNNGFYRFEYFMKDHLGNTRATYAPAAPGVTQVAEYQHYYPFGMQMEAFCYTSGIDILNLMLYNGKELQTDFELQWYDYGARFYDPELGRWHSLDQLASNYYKWSTYCYVLNNPLKYADSDGRLVVFAPGTSQEFKNKFATTVRYMNIKGSSGIMKSLNDSKTIYYILETDGNINKFSPKNKTILWNPELAKITTEGVILSPATLLNHEFDHANQSDKNPDQFKNDANEKDKDYDNKEEKRVIEGSEQKTAKKHGEISDDEVTRKDHTMIGVIQVNDPTSTGNHVDVVGTKNDTKNKKSTKENKNDDENK